MQAAAGLQAGRQLQGEGEKSMKPVPSSRAINIHFSDFHVVHSIEYVTTLNDNDESYDE